MKDFVLIVAGGVGRRMGGALPKQFMKLKGVPIILRTIERFTSFDPNLNVVVVLHPEYIELFQELCDLLKFPFKCQVVKGGDSRFQSVKNGVDALPSDAHIVGVHDAVRPFVSDDTLERCFGVARRKGNAIPVTPLVDSIREIVPSGSKMIDRTKLRLVQTPQCFEYSLLRDAYLQNESALFTDDASVVEALGIKMVLVDGNRLNFKITTPEDLDMANAICP
ncbi:MAG: 2-C-methyl-D-erythritol 4-phosphate cytidylyltransferase [Flavobacteriales bacterium]